MSKATVTKIEREVKRGLMPSLINPAWTAGREASTEGWKVVVEIDEGTFEFSQLDGETGWTADAFTPAGSSCPMFYNGFGARYLATKQAGESLASIIDEAVAAVTAGAEAK